MYNHSSARQGQEQSRPRAISRPIVTRRRRMRRWRSNGGGRTDPKSQPSRHPVHRGPITEIEAEMVQGGGTPPGAAATRRGKRSERSGQRGSLGIGSLPRREQQNATSFRNVRRSNRTVLVGKRSRRKSAVPESVVAARRVVDFKGHWAGASSRTRPRRFRSPSPQRTRLSGPPAPHPAN